MRIRLVSSRLFCSILSIMNRGYNKLINRISMVLENPTREGINALCYLYMENNHGFENCRHRSCQFPS